MKKVEGYRCPKCGTIVLAADVDDERMVYPPGVPANACGQGQVRVTVRPGPLYCHSPAHPNAVSMRREMLDARVTRRIGR